MYNKFWLGIKQIQEKKDKCNFLRGKVIDNYNKYQIALAKENKIGFLEASAYKNYNISELFSKIGEEILEKIIDNNTTTTPNTNMILLPTKQAVIKRRKKKIVVDIINYCSNFGAK